ncbi:hypothetical protein GNI_082410 [Gregarina niphandrodes]|uniref:Uncharacterized protein n=1 Tax=Gregarina niphandrodes TaxID=110365 RepID=A0A023B6D6_GRENI|nr:hypothetical protein GNI_082410 [Gregarina niphandrodes]EZG65669.1 hypothetical protein GNI_082410 [Gregarina niphandrodes]|eukprot:XP_011134062.1 hypothetical protein GNI_082410 [Gregarina niphandrodes]
MAAIEPTTSPRFVTLLRDSYLVYELFAYGLMGEYTKSYRPMNCYGRLLNTTLKIGDGKINEFVQANRHFFAAEVYGILSSVVAPSNLIHLIKILELLLLYEDNEINKVELVNCLMGLLLNDPPLQEKESTHVKGLLVSLLGGQPPCTSFLVSLLDTPTYTPLPDTDYEVVRGLLSLLFDCAEDCVNIPTISHPPTASLMDCRRKRRRISAPNRFAPNRLGTHRLAKNRAQKTSERSRATRAGADRARNGRGASTDSSRRWRRRPETPETSADTTDGFEVLSSDCCYLSESTNSLVHKEDFFSSESVNPFLSRDISPERSDLADDLDKPDHIWGFDSSSSAGGGETGIVIVNGQRLAVCPPSGSPNVPLPLELPPLSPFDLDGCLIVNGHLVDVLAQDINNQMAAAEDPALTQDPAAAGVGRVGRPDKSASRDSTTRRASKDAKSSPADGQIRINDNGGELSGAELPGGEVPSGTERSEDGESPTSEESTRRVPRADDSEKTLGKRRSRGRRRKPRSRRQQSRRAEEAEAVLALNFNGGCLILNGVLIEEALEALAPEVVAVAEEAACEEGAEETAIVAGEDGVVGESRASSSLADLDVLPFGEISSTDATDELEILEEDRHDMELSSSTGSEDLEAGPAFYVDGSLYEERRAPSLWLYLQASLCQQGLHTCVHARAGSPRWGLRVSKPRKVRLPSATLVSSSNSVNNLSDLLRRLAESCVRVAPPNALLSKFLRDMYLWPAIALLLTGGITWRSMASRRVNGRLRTLRSKPAKADKLYCCRLSPPGLSPSELELEGTQTPIGEPIVRLESLQLNPKRLVLDAEEHNKRSRVLGGVCSGKGPSLDATLNAIGFVSCSTRLNSDNEAFLAQSLPLIDGLLIQATIIYVDGKKRRRPCVRWMDGQRVLVSKVGRLIDFCLAIVLKTIANARPGVRFPRPLLLNALTKLLLGDVSVVVRSRALEILRRCFVLSQRNMKTTSWLIETDVIRLCGLLSSSDMPSDLSCSTLSLLQAVDNLAVIPCDTGALLRKNLYLIPNWEELQRKIVHTFRPASAQPITERRPPVVDQPAALLQPSPLQIYARK